MQYKYNEKIKEKIKQYWGKQLYPMQYKCIWHAPVLYHVNMHLYGIMSTWTHIVSCQHEPISYHVNMHSYHIMSTHSYNIMSTHTNIVSCRHAPISYHINTKKNCVASSQHETMLYHLNMKHVVLCQHGYIGWN